MDGDQTDLQHFWINVWIFGVVDHSGYCSHLHCLWKKLFNKELAFFINWKCSSHLGLFYGLCYQWLFTDYMSIICNFIHWHFYQWHFYRLAFLPPAFLPFVIFTTGIITVWHFYYWHFYHLAYLPMTFLPSGIFTNGILTIWHFHQWHFYLWQSYLWHFYQWHFYLHPYGVAKIVALLYSTKWLVVFRSQATRICGFGLHSAGGCVMLWDFLFNLWHNISIFCEDNTESEKIGCHFLSVLVTLSVPWTKEKKNHLYTNITYT